MIVIGLTFQYVCDLRFKPKILNKTQCFSFSTLNLSAFPPSAQCKPMQTLTKMQMAAGLKSRMCLLICIYFATFLAYYILTRLLTHCVEHIVIQNAPVMRVKYVDPLSHIIQASAVCCNKSNKITQLKTTPFRRLFLSVIKCSVFVTALQ